MKRFFINILLLSVYVAALLRPVIPLLEYFSNYDYISKVLCENKNKPFLKCNGTCYLEKQFKNANLLVNGKNSPETILTTKEIFFPIFVLEVFDYSLATYFKEKLVIPNFFKSLNIRLLFNLIFKPPRFA